MADEMQDRPLADYEVLLCVSGGIAAYKSADLAGRLICAGADVTVAMTEAAQQFVTPLTFQTLTAQKVYTSLWQSSEEVSCRHISLTEAADLMIIAPATADIIAKMACGLADDLVSTMTLSAHGACEVLIAPAMNARMWSAPPTGQNVQLLKNRGIYVVGPATGRLACGTVGIGRMAEAEDILAAAIEILHTKPPKRTV